MPMAHSWMVSCCLAGESLCWRTEPQGKCKWWILVVSSCTVVIMFRLHFSWVTIGCVVGRSLCVSRSEPQEKANDKTLLVKRLIGDRVDGSSSQLCPLVAGKRRFIASSLESRTWKTAASVCKESECVIRVEYDSIGIAAYLLLFNVVCRVCCYWPRVIRGTA